MLNRPAGNIQGDDGDDLNGLMRGDAECAGRIRVSGIMAVSHLRDSDHQHQRDADDPDQRDESGPRAHV